MKKKFLFGTMAILVFFTMLVGCSTEQSITDENQIKKESEMRTIIDMTGNEVELPPASEINKVIIIAPPLLATYSNVVKDTDKLVGVHPRCLSDANQDLLELVVPNYESINTGFLKGFTSNAEEVLKMEPDVILVYGDFQKEGLENVDIPIVDFYLKNPINEDWSIQIDKLMRQVFEIEDENTLEKEWLEANKIVDDALKNVKDEDKKTAIMVRNIDEESFTVRGGNYYGDDWLIKTGLINLAKELEGDSSQISMEQLYEWNPDIVYDFLGSDSDLYLANGIKGKDWSSVNAYENKEIYDIPEGMFNWGAPNTDSPLTLVWMTMKNYPGLIEEDFFNNYMKEFYKRQYDIDLSDELMESILNPQK